SIEPRRYREWSVTPDPGTSKGSGLRVWCSQTGDVWRIPAESASGVASRLNELEGQRSHALERAEEMEKARDKAREALDREVKEHSQLKDAWSAMVALNRTGRDERWHWTGVSEEDDLESLSDQCVVSIFGAQLKELVRAASQIEVESVSKCGGAANVE
ncbi:MAG: hypothetical protein AAGG01_24305, partial [Planctomycetota bacterium]